MMTIDSRGRAAHDARRGRAARLTLLASAVCLAALTSAASAQQMQLRGQASEDEINRQVLPRAGLRPGTQPPLATDTAQSGYRPFSAGAVPDETDPADEDLFVEQQAEEDADPFAGDAPPRPTPVAATPPASPRRENAEQRAGAATAAGRETDQQGAQAQEEEEEVTTGGIRQGTVDDLYDEMNSRIEAENPRLNAIEGRGLDAETNPYAPLGLRLGTFNANARMDTGLTWTSNADSSYDGGEALLSETQLRLNAVSDWSRHLATINAYAIIRESVSGQELSEIDFGIDGSFVADLSEDYSARAALAYTVEPESATSPDALQGDASQPLEHEFSAELGLEKDGGKIRYGITGGLDRQMYSDANLTTGEALSQEDRNNTLAELTLRGGYEVSPAFVPFAEVTVGRRFYDNAVDTGGYERSANRLAGAVGADLDFGEKLTGEASIGWQYERYDDDELAPISALLLDAALNWSPMRGTMVSLNATTQVEGTTNPAQSGSVYYYGVLGLTREVRANLTVGARAGLGWRDYVASPDHELELDAELNSTWWLNRYAGITGRLRHETFDSTLPDRDSTTNSVYLGLTLQR